MTALCPVIASAIPTSALIKSGSAAMSEPACQLNWQAIEGVVVAVLGNGQPGRGHHHPRQLAAKLDFR